jgi:cyclopropane-fatty-acyl-phospholipid synthase
MAMIVKFVSSAAGELIMMDDVARPLLLAIGKACTAQGVILKAEIPAALAALSQLLADQPPPAKAPKTDDEESEARQPPPVTLQQRAWPFQELLRRTAKSKKKEASILWRAKADFEKAP